MLNWRCPSNPKSGGAEYVTRKHLEAWVLAGHEVHWLAGGAKGLPRYEKLKVSDITKKQFEQAFPRNSVTLSADFVGHSRCNRNLSTHPEEKPVIHIHRYGTPITVYFLAPLLYWFKWRGKYDIVIDQIHGVPFLTPLWAWKSRKIAFIHEVAQEIWDEMLPFPINIMGKIYEKVYFLFYRNIHFWTVSNSTKMDLLAYGIRPDSIHVIPNAIDIQPVSEVPEKEKNLTLLFVGRLVKMKGVEDAIEIFSNIKNNHSEATLWILGSGEERYVAHLKELVVQLRLESSVIFRGYVSEEEKHIAYQRAHYLLHTSIREGFGLTVLEANSQGTPVIAYDSPGLHEIVIEHINGFLLSRDNIRIEVEKVLSQQHSVKYSELCMTSIKFTTRYNWNTQTTASYDLLTYK